jgi:DNA-binding HxlR family transcriptional regulator
MNKYGQYCPVARSAEILGDRWTLLILRDMLCGAQHFNDLERGLPGIPRALLSERLRRLQRVGVLERQDAPRGKKACYKLTQAGRELLPLLDVLIQWGAKWAFGEPELSELDPTLLMWWMHDRVNPERLPQRRVVVEFDFRGASVGSYWLVLQEGAASVCHQHPGFDVDVVVAADLAAMYKVWLGQMTFAEAMHDGSIELQAPPSLARAFPTWFAFSPAASGVRKARTLQHIA